ncbi:MAG: right-handed parallel beta-helix repeat-containing protein [Planctomycetota bacterium]
MKRLFQASCIILVLFGSAYTRDIHVPGEYATIQQAIEAAVDGDSVMVEPGTYPENLVFRGKRIDVRSTQGAGATLIDGRTLGTVVCFQDSETEDSLLEGFTLFNGKGKQISNNTYGGGVYLGERCQPVLRSLVIRDNKAKYGGAVYGTDASPTLEHCMISNNNGTVMGAAVCCNNGSDMKLIHCTISDNESVGHGGGLSCYDSSPMIVNCVIAFNKAGAGAGIYSGNGDHNPVIINSNVVMNYASGWGSGFYCISYGSIVNSIFWNIPSTKGSEIHLQFGGEVEATCSVVRGGWPGAGNIDLKPEFLFAYNHDFHIVSTSPCIDAGADDLPYHVDYDMDGDPRVINNKIDIGADEFSTPHGSPGEYYVPDDYPGIQEAIDASFPGDVILVRPGTYVENVDFKGQPITLKSSDGPGQTVIDGGGGTTDSKPVVQFRFLEDADSVLQGFTVTNGSGYKPLVDDFAMGGGVFIDMAAPSLIDNIIEHNRADYGGGVCSYSGVHVLRDSVIRANTASNGAGLCLFGLALVENCTIEENLSGAAVYIDSFIETADTVTLRNNVIKNHQEGSGIYCQGKGEFIIENNRILNNISSNQGGGINITGSNNSSFIRNNTIIGNHALYGGGINCANEYVNAHNNIIACNIVAGHGGGITCANGGVFSNNIICYNVANTTPSGNQGLGGGILANQADHLLISNCIIYKNSAARYGGGLYLYEGVDMVLSHLTIVKNSAQQGNALYTSGQAFVNLSNSILRNEGRNEIYSESTFPDVVYSNVKGGWAGISNIDGDPRFVDESENDFHLLHDSPCRNTGSNDYAVEDEDYEGDPRIAYGTVDMGADEFHNHLYCTGDFIPNGTIESNFIGLPDTWPVGLFIGTGIMDPPLQHMWGEFCLESPWFLIPLVPIPSSGVLAIQATLPSTAAPYDIPMQALIGWDLSNLFVLEVR